VGESGYWLDGREKRAPLAGGHCNRYGVGSLPLGGLVASPGAAVGSRRVTSLGAIHGARARSLRCSAQTRSLRSLRQFAPRTLRDLGLASMDASPLAQCHLEGHDRRGTGIGFVVAGGWGGMLRFTYAPCFGRVGFNDAALEMGAFPGSGTNRWARARGKLTRARTRKGD
jgi:hypothetical protein